MSGGHNLAPGWFKSSLSNPGECVEVLFADGQVHVRHSRDPIGPALSFNKAEWRAFLDGVRLGEFDFPES